MGKCPTAVVAHDALGKRVDALDVNPRTALVGRLVAFAVHNLVAWSNGLTTLATGVYRCDD
jgi:hypothetical protein